MQRRWRSLAMIFAATALAAACNDMVVDADKVKTEAPGGVVARPGADPVIQAPASANPAAQAIDRAAFAPVDVETETGRQTMIRAQVLLDRARFSPGVIDGRYGENVRQAIAAFEAAHGLPVDGQLDQQVFARLTEADSSPIMQDYVITEADVAGPFVEKIPTRYEDMAKLEKLAYTSPAERLAEKFHMDERLLRELNPDADFGRAGTTLLVVRPGGDQLNAEVVRVEVDKTEREVRAYDAANRLLAVYPATVGSKQTPAPSGEWEVSAIARDPTWNYDPTRLSFGDADRKLTIAPGPNNPVGLVWIALTKDTYGIHGTPDPAQIGKSESNGCVRLTNWDALELASGVRKGTKVVFVGKEGAAGRRAASSAT